MAFSSGISAISDGDLWELESSWSWNITLQRTPPRTALRPVLPKVQCCSLVSFCTQISMYYDPGAQSLGGYFNLPYIPLTKLQVQGRYLYTLPCELHLS